MTRPRHHGLAAEDDGWPDTRRLIDRSVADYLAHARDARNWDLPTRCPPWTVRDITRHLAATFTRFDLILAKSRTGDLTPPFHVDDVPAENLRAVADFEGEPETRLSAAVGRFTAATEDLDEPIAHQFGPIPVGLQLALGLNELAIHHDDIRRAAGHRWRPPREVIDVLTHVWRRALTGLPEGTDDWSRILRASGRNSS